MPGRSFVIALVVASATALNAESPPDLRAVPEAGPNLAVNPSFNSNIIGWSSSFLATSWSNIDRSGSTSSGSALLKNQDPSANMAGYFYQCVSIVPGRSYVAGASVMVPAGQTRTGAIWSTYSFSSSCFTPTDRSIYSGSPVTADGLWRPTTLASGTAGASATKLTVAVGLGKFQAGGEFRIHFDDFYVNEISPTLYIYGPSSGPALIPAAFNASWNGCEPTGTDWNWSATGSPTIVGQKTRFAVFNWPSPGTYTVTLTNSSCAGGASAKQEIAIAARAPQIAVTSAPRGMVQGQVTSDSFALTNLGGSSTTVSLRLLNGGTFSIAPTSFALAPGAAQIVTVGSLVGKASAEQGASETPDAVNLTTDAVIPSGVGVPANLKVPLQMLLAGQGSGEPVVRADPTRVDVVASPSSPTASGSVTFTNTGSATLLAAVVPKAPWITPSKPSIEIPAGGSQVLSFLVDRSLRPDAQSPLGSAIGDLTLIFRRLGLSGRSPLADPGIAGVTVVDSAPPPSTSTGIPALSGGEVALFVPGIGHKRGSVGLFISDVSLVNFGNTIPINGLTMYFLPIGGATAQKSDAISLATETPLTFGDVVSAAFGANDSVGTLQVRSTNSSQLWYQLSLGATVFNSSNPAGVYGTAIPVFRSDRSARAGMSIYLPGLRKDADAHTNLYLQEVGGATASVKAEFLSTTGTVLGTRTETLAPFALVQWVDVVPAGAVTAVVTSDGASSGRVVSYATPVDRASGDTWAVADWALYYSYAGYSSARVIPVAGVVHGANQTYYRSDVAVMNVASTPVSLTCRYDGRAGEKGEKTIQLAPKETRILPDVVAGLFGITGDSVGAVTVVPPYPSDIRVTSRTYTTSAGKPGTYGTAVPAIAYSAGPGDVRRMGGFEDASLATISAGRPGTFRTNIGFIETSGKTAKVHVRLRWEALSGTSSLAATRGYSSKEYTLTPRQMLLLSNVAREIIGPSRDTQFGDMRNLDIEFQVLEGYVIPFVTSTDNGTGDSILRTE